MNKRLKSHSFFLKYLLILIFITFTHSVFAETIKVGLYNNQPKIFISETGKASGIYVDILEAIAEEENWTIEYVSGTWNECLSRLENGQIDLMPDVAYNPERNKIYSFHKIQVLSSWSQIYTYKGSKISSILDLDGKKLAVLDNSVQQQSLLNFISGFDIKLTLIPYPDFEQAFEAVARKKADAVVSNHIFGLMHASKMGLEETAIIFSPSSLYFATAKNKHLDILNTIDRYLITYKADSNSVYYKSIQKWISQVQPKKLPRWVILINLAVFSLLILTTIASFILKKQVKLKTAELNKSYHEMEKKVIERTADLAEAMEKAQQADRLKSAFLATMSHELRTPLNSIIGFTGILLQGLAGELNPEQNKQLSLVKKSANHLLSLINDVLDISKIESGQLYLYYEDFDIRASIDKSIKLIMPASDNKGIQLEVNIAPEIDKVYCDQRRIEQVILNLLSNAVKFTEQGYVRLTCFYDNENCIISIEDSGIGMDSHEMDKLFLPFSQIDTGLSRKYEGTGLGLSICKKLIEMMNGNIRVKSELNKGSIFTVIFPYKKDSANILNGNNVKQTVTSQVSNL